LFIDERKIKFPSRIAHTKTESMTSSAFASTLSHEALRSLSFNSIWRLYRESTLEI